MVGTSLLTEEAIERADRGADPGWKARAFTAIVVLASAGKPFTTDDVWAHLKESPREPRALGPVMRRAAQQGVIRFTGRYLPSDRRHQTPIRVWQGR